MTEYRKAKKTIVVIILLFVLVVSSCASSRPEPVQVELRGVWVQGKSIMTRQEIDEVVRRARIGGFKQIFAGVFGGGMSIYPSQVTLQMAKVETGFDPLAYLVQEAHAQNIEVHAWFAVGRLADTQGYSTVIEEHPDWGLAGPDGKTIPWLNFTNPAARQFISDLMMEAVMRGVDGVHFDYTRYPSEEWGFDEYSIGLFNQQHDFDLNELRYADLPGYGQFEGNALLLPSTAQVLAYFSNGIPAVMLNHYGKGNVLILNWKAGQRKTAVGSEILRRGIENFIKEGGRVYMLHSETNIAKYGDKSLSSVVNWLEVLGWKAEEVSPEEVGGLQPGSVLLLPYVYLYSEGDAMQLAQYVRQGGGAIFIDSPTPSMNIGDLQAVTGMRPPSKYFDDWLLMTAHGIDPLVPTSDRTDNIEFYKARNEQWVKFREDGINSLIRDVYSRVKAEHPNVLVTITITSDQEQAARVNLQDWRNWMDKGYIDALIPRAYEDSADQVKNLMDVWSPDVKTYGRMTFGVIAYIEEDNEEISKPSSQLITEIKTVLGAGSNGFMVFDLGRMTDEQLKTLAEFIPAKEKK